MWTYGGACPHGGSAFSGRTSKVDSTTTRYVAKNIGCCVAAGMIQVAAYAIVAQPMNIGVPEKTRAWSATKLSALVQETFDLRPKALSETCCARFMKNRSVWTLRPRWAGISLRTYRQTAVLHLRQPVTD
jgi:S-adenosylmethionine synthetase